MRKKIAKRKKEQSISTKNIIGILLSSGIGFIFIILLTLVASIILTKTLSITNLTAIYFMVSIAFGALITGFLASKKCEFKGLVSGIVASLPLILFTTVIMLIFSHGRLIAEIIILYLGIIMLSAIGGIISANTKHRK